MRDWKQRRKRRKSRRGSVRLRRMRAGKVCRLECFSQRRPFTDFCLSKSRATCGELADVQQGLEKEEKAEGKYSGITLGSLYVSQEVVRRVVIYSFVHQFCTSMFRNVEHLSFSSFLYCLSLVGFYACVVLSSPTDPQERDVTSKQEKSHQNTPLVMRGNPE